MFILFVLGSLIASLIAGTATTTTVAVTSIPVVGGTLAAKTTALGALAGAAATTVASTAGIANATAVGSIIAGATTTTGNRVILNAIKEAIVN
jgi:hypothetical protein